MDELDKTRGTHATHNSCHNSDVVARTDPERSLAHSLGRRHVARFERR